MANASRQYTYQHEPRTVKCADCPAILTTFSRAKLIRCAHCAAELQRRKVKARRDEKLAKARPGELVPYICVNCPDQHQQGFRHNGPDCPECGRRMTRQPLTRSEIEAAAGVNKAEAKKSLAQRMADVVKLAQERGDCFGKIDPPYWEGAKGCKVG